MSALLLHSSTSVHFYFTLTRFRDSCQEELHFLVSIRMFAFLMVSGQKVFLSYRKNLRNWKAEKTGYIC